VFSTNVKPTPEQEEALGLFASGGDMILVAVAGSGKTTTLELLARSTPKRLIYLAFNRALKEEASRRFPANTKVYTFHGLAYRQTVARDGRLEAKLRAGGGQVRLHHLADLFPRANPVLLYGIKATLENFIRSQESAPGPQHIPLTYVEARSFLSEAAWKREVEVILWGAERAWKKITDPNDPFPLSHDAYLRMWNEAGADLSSLADALLVDEAQDLDPLVRGLLARQSRVQRVYVGDPRQQIYAWRGAVNAMEDLPPSSRRTLSWSFRFGPELALAVRRLTSLPHVARPIFMEGKAPWSTRVDIEIPRPPFALLARTNAGLVEAVLRFQDIHGGKAHVVGGTEELAWLLEDAEALRSGHPRPRPHPELAAISSWDELNLLAEAGFAGVKALASLAKRYPLAELARRLREIQTPEEKALVVFSTAHKAKGREWDAVVIWSDFPNWWVPSEKDAGEQEIEEENLLYVAMTRARKHLCLRYLPDLPELVLPPASPF
jgi:superfamily I DNA/RNA helicase